MKLLTNEACERHAPRTTRTKMAAKVVADERAKTILEIAATIRSNVEAWWTRRIDQETFDLCQRAAWDRADLEGLSDDVATWLWQNPPPKTESAS